MIGRAGCGQTEGPAGRDVDSQRGAPPLAAHARRDQADVISGQGFTVRRCACALGRPAAPSGDLEAILRRVLSRARRDQGRFWSLPKRPTRRRCSSLASSSPDCSRAPAPCSARRCPPAAAVAAAFGADRRRGERRVRLRTLTLIRWIAIVGQAFTIALVHFSLEFRLPLWPLLAAVGLSALINLVLRSRFAATTRLTERSAALLLGYDILQLAFLLGLTGGLQNPFSILLIVPVTLSATTLSLRTTVVLCAAGDRGRHAARPVSDRSAVARAATFHLPPLYVGGVVARAGARHRADRGLRLADRRRGAAPVGCAGGDPDGARPRAAAVGARRPGRGGRARARQPARDHRGDRARARQQRAARTARSPRTSPSWSARASAAARSCARSASSASARSMRRSPGCRSRAC